VSEETRPSRRRFLDAILGGGVLAWLGAVLYPVFAYLKPPPETGEAVTSVMVGTIDEIPPDSGMIFKFGRKPGILIRKPDGSLKAYNAICTHLDCTVQYRQDLGLIWCACHNGRYDLNGKNIAGPPPKPLEEFRVDIRANEIFVSRTA